MRAIPQLPDVRVAHLLPTHPSAVRVSQLCMGLHPNFKVDKYLVAAFTCWLSANPMPRCVIPLGYGLGTHPCISRESKGHLAHVWTPSCLQLAPNALEVQISSAVCTDLQKAKSYSLKHTSNTIQCWALSTEQKPSAMPIQAGKVTGWPKGFVIHRLIFTLAPALESVTVYEGVQFYPMFQAPCFHKVTRGCRQ